MLMDGSEKAPVWDLEEASWNSDFPGMSIHPTLPSPASGAEIILLSYSQAGWSLIESIRKPPLRAIWLAYKITANEGDSQLAI